MDYRIFIIVLLGSIVSLAGTMSGACLGAAVKRPTDRFLGIVVGFSGGLMLSIVMFDLIPEAINKWSFSGTLISAAGGIAIIFIIDYFYSAGTAGKNSRVRVAFLAAVGLMLHNFPEGIIMGCSFAASESLGLKMSLIIAVHDIPEGIAVSAPLMAARLKLSKILWYTLITALPTAAGVWVGACLGSVSDNVTGPCLSLASGIMLYVVCGEMLPEAVKLWKGAASTFGVLAGIFLGLIILEIL
jgi:ZIP family zinc transporter